MPDSKDDLFARAAVKARAMTPQQVQECRAIQRKFIIQGVKKSLAAVAVDSGRLSPALAKKVIEAAGAASPAAAAAAPRPTQPAPAAAKSAGAKTQARSNRKAAPARRAGPAPRKTSTALILALIGGPIAAGIVVILVVALGGGGEAPTPKVSSIAPPPPNAGTPKKKETAPPPPPEKKEEAPREKKTEPPPPPPPPPPVEQGPEAEFRARMAAKRAEAMKVLARAKTDVMQDRKEAREKRERREARFKANPVTLKLRSGGAYRDARIRRYSPYELEIETAGSTRAFPWEDLEAASVQAAADAMFDPGSAAMQFDRGRFFIARRDWKRALAAFDRAAKLDFEFEDRVEEFRDMLTRLAEGEVAFRGSARGAPGGILFLKYDFADPLQVEDFTGGLRHGDGKAVLEAEKETAVLLVGSDPEEPPVFLEEATIDMTVTPSGPFTLLFLPGPQGGYELDLGPEGCALYRREPGEGGKRVELGRGKDVPLEAGRKQRIRLRVRRRKFTVRIGEKEALTAEDPPDSDRALQQQGTVGWRVPKGRLVIHAPLTIAGRMDEQELELRVGELEVFLRRALDEDLAAIEEKRIRAMAYGMLQENRDLSLTADDPYFAYRIKTNDDLLTYQELKRNLLKFFAGRRVGGGFRLDRAQAELARLIGAYPDVPALYYLRARIHQERQNRRDAAADVARALELFPEFPEALLLRASFARERLKLDEARAAVEKAIEAKPDYAPAYVRRAFLSFAGRTSFEEDLQLALSLDPTNQEAASLLRVLKIQSRGPRDLGCRFEHETEHYRVTTDISMEATKEYGELLEAGFRHFAGEFSDFYTGARFRKPRVAIFRTAENYYTYFELISETRGEHTGGVFRSSLNELVFFENVDRGDTLNTLHHEQFHHFMTLIVRDTPPYWYNEGMADYMGGIRVRGGKVVESGVTPTDRLRMAKLIASIGQPVPFSRIMVETPREFYGRGAYMRYCQSWSMIHFFHHAEGGKYRGLLTAYLRALRDRKPPQAAYDEVFAPRVEELEGAWKAYVTKLKPTP